MLYYKRTRLRTVSLHISAAERHLISASRVGTALDNLNYIIERLAFQARSIELMTNRDLLTRLFNK